MNNNILDRDESWLEKASEDELREFLRCLDDMEDCPRKQELTAAFDKECNRRTGEYYEKLNNGEWL